MKKEENSPTVGERFDVKGSAWPLFAGLALIALLAGMVAVSCGGATGEQRAQDSQDPTGNEPQAAADLGHPSLGEKDAPVVMIEYGDYQ